MSIEQLLTMECTLHNKVAAGTDRYGTPIHTETTTVEPCWVQQLSAGEQGVSEVDVGKWRLYLRPEAVITDTTTVTLPDSELPYEVDGEPRLLSHPRQGPHHIEAILRKTT